MNRNLAWQMSGSSSQRWCFVQLTWVRIKTYLYLLFSFLCLIEESASIIQNICFPFMWITASGSIVRRIGLFLSMNLVVSISVSGGLQDWIRLDLQSAFFKLSVPAILIFTLFSMRGSASDLEHPKSLSTYIILCLPYFFWCQCIEFGCGSIILTGGSTLFPHFAKRL